MTGLTNAGKQKVLNNLVSGTSYLGLAIAIPQTGADPTLANITEVTTGGYARKSVTWGTAVFPGPPVSISSAADLTFGPMTADMTAPANYAFLCDVATGNALAAPTSLTAGAPTTGGSNTWASTGTYYWVVTGTNAQGETLASNEVSATITALNQQVALSWTAVTGATGYNIYRGTVAGGENVKVTSVTGTSYTATGAAGTPGTPPAIATAPAGNIWYVWSLAAPAQAPNGKPVLIPASGLAIQ